MTTSSVELLLIYNVFQMQVTIHGNLIQNEHADICNEAWAAT